MGALRRGFPTLPSRTCSAVTSAGGFSSKSICISCAAAATSVIGGDLDRSLWTIGDRGSIPIKKRFCEATAKDSPFRRAEVVAAGSSRGKQIPQNRAILKRFNASPPFSRPTEDRAKERRGLQKRVGEKALGSGPAAPRTVPCLASPRLA